MYKWHASGLKELLTSISSVEAPCIFIQGRFDGAYRQTCKRSAIGVSIELVRESTRQSTPLLDLGQEMLLKDSYEAEMCAAEALTRECLKLYTKLHIATNH